MEHYKKNDASKFFEVDTVLGGVLALNLRQVRSVVIQRELSKAAGHSPSEKSLSAHYAGEPIAEHINCAEKDDIHLLAKMLANTDAIGSDFVFVENEHGGRHFFSINEVNYFVLPYYDDVTDGNLVDGVPELDAKSGC